jgi:hypothetical protein
MKTKNKVILLMFFFTCTFTNAQASKSNETDSTNSNSTNTRYYYFPNIQAYFDLNEKVYLYKHNGEWIEGEELPQYYGGYSLYNKVKVSITDYDGDKPYLMLETHKKLYPYNSKGRFPNQNVTNN